MSDTQQLVYASRATFKPAANGGGVEPEVARILAQSRRNNPRRELVGALYYGDGCFFQCLEGPQAAIDKLYDELSKDPRHTEVKVLRRQFIGSTSFAGWSMKYVPAAADVQGLLSSHGLSRFDPFAFDNQLLDQMVSLLHQRKGPPGPSESPATAARKSSSLALKLGIAAIALAAAALLIALLR